MSTRREAIFEVMARAQARRVARRRVIRSCAGVFLIVGVVGVAVAASAMLRARPNGIPEIADSGRGPSSDVPRAGDAPRGLESARQPAPAFRPRVRIVEATRATTIRIDSGVATRIEVISDAELSSLLARAGRDPGLVRVGDRVLPAFSLASK